MMKSSLQQNVLIPSIRKAGSANGSSDKTSVKTRAQLIVPIVTPLTQTGRLDREALPGLVEHIIQGGADALFLLGTTGEGPSLSASQGQTFVKLVAAMVPADVDLYVCVSASCFQEALAMARCAAQVGATAIVATAPFYYPLSDDELVTYFTILAEQSPLPLMLYNFPRMTGTALSPQVILRLSQVPGIIGLKDSGGDRAVLDEVLRGVKGRTDFTVYVGDEKLLSHAIRAGANGGVCGAGNMTPKLFRDLLDAIKKDDVEAESVALKQMAVVHRLFEIGDQWGRYVVNIKFVLSELGLCRPCSISPLREPTPDEALAIRALLEHFPLEEASRRSMKSNGKSRASTARLAVAVES